MRPRGTAASNRSTQPLRSSRRSKTARDEAPQSANSGFVSSPNGGRRWAVEPASAEHSWRGDARAKPKARTRRHQTARFSERLSPRATGARTSRESVVRAVAAHMETSQSITSSGKALRARASSPFTCQRAFNADGASRRHASSARSPAATSRRSFSRTDPAPRRGSVPANIRDYSQKTIGARERLLAFAYPLPNITQDDGRTHIQRLLTSKRSRKKVIPCNECPMSQSPSDKVFTGHRKKSKQYSIVQKVSSNLHEFLDRDFTQTKKSLHKKTSVGSSSLLLNRVSEVPAKISVSDAMDRVNSMKRVTFSASKEVFCEGKSRHSQGVESQSCTTLSLSDGVDSGSVNGEQVNWEKVLLSVQVQLSPVCSPCPSVVPLVDPLSTCKLLSPKSRHNFQTSSEVVALPILARPQGNGSNVRITDQTSDHGIGRDIDGWSSTSVSLDSKKFEAMTTMSEIEIKLHETQEVFQKSFDLEEEKLESLPRPSSYKDDCVISSVDETLTSLTNCSIYENLHNTSEDSAKNSLPQNKLVAELRIDQSDIVKMAYDIVNMVSRSHMTKGSQSFSSDHVEFQNNVIRRSTSVDLGIKAKRIYLSTKKNLSMNNLNEIVRNKKDSSVHNKFKNMSFGGTVESKNTSTLKPSDVSTTDIKRNSVYSNCLDFASVQPEHSTRIPILLYQNEQVRKILKDVESKLKQTNINSEKQCDQRLPELELPFNLESATAKDSYIKSQAADKNTRNPDKRQTKIGNFQGTICSRRDTWRYDESATSEMETELSLVDSEAGANDGDDEDTSMSEGPREQAAYTPAGGEQPISSCACSETQDAPAGAPRPLCSCACSETHDVCPRHPAEDGDSEPAGRCLCERFQEICVPDARPITETNDQEKDLRSDDNPGAQSSVASRELSQTPTQNTNEEYIPWTLFSSTGPTIPDFDPGEHDNESVISLPAHAVTKATDIFKGPPNDSVSVYNEEFAIPPWLESSKDEGVPDTITEFHWMPDNVRGFSSTILNPEIPENLAQIPPDDRPFLVPPQSVESPGTSVYSGFTNVRRPDSPDAAINLDAPREVPSPRAKTWSLSSAADAEGPLLQVITNAVEKSLTPLQSAIHELKEKINMLESQSPGIKPDLLVGVASMTPCPGHCTSDPASRFVPGRSPEGHEEYGTSPCGHPFGIYILRQHTNMLPPCGNIGNVREGHSAVPVMCFHCTVEKDQSNASNSSVVPNANANSDPNADPNTSPNADAQADPNARPNADVNEDSNADSNASPDADANADLNADPNKIPNAGSQADSNVDPNASANADGNTDLNANPNADSETNKNEDLNPNTDSNSNTNANLNADSNGSPKGDSNTDAIADSNANTHEDKANSEAGSASNGVTPQTITPEEKHSLEEKPECCKIPDGAKAESPLDSASPPAEPDCCKLVYTAEQPQTTLAEEQPDVLLKDSGIRKICKKCGLSALPDCAECCKTPSPEDGPKEGGEVAPETSKGESDETAQETPKSEGRVPDCCILPSTLKELQTPASVPQESSAMPPAGVPQPGLPASSPASGQSCPKCQPCPAIPVRAFFSEQISESSIVHHGSQTHAPSSPAEQHGRRPPPAGATSRLSNGQERPGRPQSERCPGCNKCPYSYVPGEQKPTLSPIAQMYLDMSKAKHDWSDDFSVTPSQRESSSDRKEAPTEDGKVVYIQKDTKLVPSGNKDERSLTFKFPRHMCPEIGICLTGPDNRRDTNTSTSHPNSQCICTPKRDNL